MIRAGDAGLRESYVEKVIGSMIINAFVKKKKWRKDEKRWRSKRRGYNERDTGLIERVK